MKYLLRAFMIIIGIFLFIIIALEAFSVVKYHQIKNEYEDSSLDEVNYIEVDGIHVAYRLYGDNDNAPIVLIHGFMGSSFDFHDLSLKLSENYYVVAIDLIGFGLSDKPQDYDYSKANQAILIQQVLSLLDIQDYILAGHSMGGEIAIRLAYLDETSVKKLVLFASAGLSDTHARALPSLINDIVFKNYFIQRLGFNLAFGNETYQTKERFEQMYYFNRTIPGNVISALSLSNDSLKVTDFIEEITIETLIIYGKDDRITPASLGELFVTKLPNSTLHLLDDTGHMPFIESLDEVLTILMPFLQTNESLLD